MLVRAPAVVAALVLAAAPLLAQKPAAASPPVASLPLAPEAERAALDAAVARGRLLFGLDRAAWVATDDFAERVPDYATSGARGYVVERDGDGFAVTFYGGSAEAPVAFYRGDVRNHRVRGRELFPADARPPLTAEQRRLAAARDAAGAAVVGRSCARRPFNSAVVPPATPGGPIDVYLLTPQVNDGEYPLGGHFRLTVAPDGTAGSERAFTRSCIAMSPSAGTPSGSTPAGMVISHLLDPVPTEIHVFTAIASRLPVYVAIAEPERLYEVTGEGIRLIR